MAATVLNSERAVEMSVFVVRAFVRLREMLATNQQLASKIDELEQRLDTHDASLQDLIEAIRELMAPTVGYRPKDRFRATRRGKSPASHSRKVTSCGPAPDLRIR